MNTVVIAALALTVLIVLIVIFTQNVKIFGQGVRSCEGKKGSCMALVECNDQDGQVYRNTDCDDSNAEGMDKFSDNYQVCCVNLFG